MKTLSKIKPKAIKIVAFALSVAFITAIFMIPSVSALEPPAVLNVNSKVADPEDTKAEVEFKPGEIYFTGVPAFSYSQKGYPTSATTVDLYPRRDSDRVPQDFIGVHDLRGDYNDWSVTVKLGNFYQYTSGNYIRKEKESPTLHGTVLVLAPPTISIAEGSTVEVDDLTARYPMGEEVRLKSGSKEAQEIIHADMAPSWLVWNATIPYARLEIPANTAKLGYFKATLTWAIENTP